jgi:hypothetical protein
MGFWTGCLQSKLIDLQWECEEYFIKELGFGWEGGSESDVMVLRELDEGLD